MAAVPPDEEWRRQDPRNQILQEPVDLGYEDFPSGAWGGAVLLQTALGTAAQTDTHLLVGQHNQGQPGLCSQQCMQLLAHCQQA